MRSALVLVVVLGFARGGELAHPAPAATPDLAFPLSNGRLGTLVSGSTTLETLPLLEAPAAAAADPARPGAGFTGRSLGDLRFEWLDAATPPSGYRRHLDLATGIATVTFKRGSAGFTATTFVSRADDLLVLHLRTDKPGFLSFRVRLGDGETKSAIEERRILARRHARAWVYPMESEVTPGDGEISVHGEGEALLLVAATSDPAKAAALPGRLQALLPADGEHPDVQALWSGLLERQKKSPAAADFPAYLKSLSAP
jgi:hypothetical protein